MCLFHTLGYWSQPLDPRGSFWCLKCFMPSQKHCSCRGSLQKYSSRNLADTAALGKSYKNQNSHVKQGKKKSKKMFPCDLMINHWLGGKYFKTSRRGRKSLNQKMGGRRRTAASSRWVELDEVAQSPSQDASLVRCSRYVSLVGGPPGTTAGGTVSLAWKCLGVLPVELDEVAGESEVWASLLWMDGLLDGWMDGWITDNGHTPNVNDGYKWRLSSWKPWILELSECPFKKPV